MTGDHSAEWSPDWQYGVVHWLALVNEPLLSEVRPAEMAGRSTRMWAMAAMW